LLECFNQVYGKKELWYKHDDNAHYYAPLPDRLGACGGEEIKKKFVGVEASKRTTNWYHHEHAPGEDGYKPEPIVSHAGIMPHRIRANEKKVYGEGPPVWYEHKWTPSELEDDAKPRPRVTMQEAVVSWTKDRCGTPAEWFVHDPTVPEAEPYRPRVTTDAAEQIAIRATSESKNSTWADPSRNRGGDEGDGHGRNVSSAVQGMLYKGSGGNMQKLIRMEKPSDRSQSPQHLAIKPEAEQNARNNIVGSMKSVFNEHANKDYVDEIGAGVRAIRPEAQETFEKNKGVMSDCFQGYRDQPFAKSVHKAQNPEIAIKHSGASMEKIIQGTGPPGSGRGHGARAVKPEAEENARTNNGGSMHDIFFAGASQFVSRGPKVRSDLAVEIARKDRGFVVDLIR